MRLPSGNLHDVVHSFIGEGPYALLGCLSPEDRSISVPWELSTRQCKQMHLLKVVDPVDAFPDYSVQAEVKTRANEKKLRARTSDFTVDQMGLLATDDDLLDQWEQFSAVKVATTLVLDITSLPKRYFCFFVKTALQTATWANVVVTYASAAGYTKGHLAQDPRPTDFLPGFSTSLATQAPQLVVAVGFEALGVGSIMRTHSKGLRETKILISSPPQGEFVKRQWQTIMQMAGDEPSSVDPANIRVVAAWDTEEVYFMLDAWAKEAGELVLAPFGAKPHSLGMALFAAKYDGGLLYTQPMSYNPSYSFGQGHIWAYVVKWDSIPCYDRISSPP